MATDNVVSLNPDSIANRLPTAKIQQLTSACQAIADEKLQDAAASLFDHIDDELYAQAEKSLNDTLQTSYFVAMRELRVLRGNIIEVFLKKGTDSLDAYINGQHAQTQNQDDDGDVTLELLNEDELEENLAVVNIVSKVEKRFKTDIDTLTRRMAFLCGHSEHTALANPLAPSNIVESFRAALDLWHGNLLVKLVIYKLFDKYVMTLVGDMYKELNDLLISEHILPRLPRSAHSRSSVAKQAERQSSATVDNADPASISARVSMQESSLAGLANELNALAGDQRAALGLPTIPVVIDINLPKIGVDELVDVLGKLQSAFVAGSPFNLKTAQSSNSEFKSALMEGLGVTANSINRKQLEKPDQHIIDVVMILFDFVLDDDMMSDQMKVLLGRLQIPMLRAAVMDRDFLSNKYHPARALLNNLARAAVRWEDDDDRSERSLYSQIDVATSTVVENFDGQDVSIFETVDKQFMSFVSKEVRGAKIAEQRLSQIAKGQEQLSVARSRVSKELDGRMGYDLPTAAFRILDEGWRDVLTLALLREGEESRGWQRGLALTDELVLSVTPQETSWERQKVMRSIPLLLKELRAGFKAVSYDPVKTNRMFKELQICHINALRGGDVKKTKLNSDVTAAGALKAVEQSARVKDQYDTWASNLKVEQWITWELDDGSRIRAKLVWRSDAADALIFVNRKGKKVLEKSIDELAEAARAKKALLVRDITVPIIDRALHSISSLLKGKQRGGLLPTPA